MSLVSLERWLNQPGGDFQLPAQKGKSPVVGAHCWGCEAPALKDRLGRSAGQRSRDQRTSQHLCRPASSATAGARAQDLRGAI